MDGLYRTIGLLILSISLSSRLDSMEKQEKKSFMKEAHRTTQSECYNEEVGEFDEEFWKTSENLSSDGELIDLTMDTLLADTQSKGKEKENIGLAIFRKKIGKKKKISTEDICYIEMLPAEIIERITDFLPYSDLSNFARCIKPTCKVAEMFQATFFLHLANQKPLSEKSLYALLHFFETTKYKKQKKLFYSSASLQDLDTALPYCQNEGNWYQDAAHDINALSPNALRYTVGQFVTKTPDEWEQLHSETRKVITFVQFSKIRKRILYLFKKRLKTYNHKAFFNVGTLIPGSVCCTIGGAGFTTGLVLSSLSGAYLYAFMLGSGFGCMVLGGITCCAANNQKCTWCEVCHPNPFGYEEDNDEKIARQKKFEHLQYILYCGITNIDSNTFNLRLY